MNQVQISPAADIGPPAKHLSAAMGELREERKRVEQFTNEQYGRLNRLRELIRTEKAEAEADLARQREELRTKGPWAAEVEQLCQRLEQTLAERDAWRVQVQNLGEQYERLQQESAEREAQFTSELMLVEEEMANQEQEFAVERQRMNEGRQQLEEQLADMQQGQRVPQAPRAVVAKPAGAARVAFDCLQCGQKLRAHQHLAGMRVTCPKCRQASVIPPLPGR